MRIKSIGSYLYLLMILSSGSVSAQEWLADRSQTEGPGILLGNSLVMHLGLGLEGGFDSNATYRSDGVRAGRLRITPYLDIASRSRQRLAGSDNAVQLAPPKALFRFGVAMFYDRYFASDSDTVDRLNKKFNPFGIDSHLNFTLLPERKISIIGGVEYVKAMEPYESVSDTQSRHDVSPKLGLRFRPGGGTLRIEPSYRYRLVHFSDDNIGRNSNKFNHDVDLKINWKVFPKTALLSETRFSPIRYYGAGTDNVESNPIKSYLGLQGLLLHKFGLRLLGGYGASFYASGDNFDGFVGDAALMFFFTPTSKVTVGGSRDFVDSFYANFFTRTGGYLSYDQMFAGMLLMTLKSGLYKHNYSRYQHSETGNYTGGGTYSVVANTNNREDVRSDNSLMLELRASDWLAFHITARVLADVTDFAYDYNYEGVDGDTLQQSIGSDYLKFDIFAGVRAHY